ncbi:hypothetical protein [Macrococcus animalis]|uniref:hypothetical protein n=1 Tax=Macrococcus animalis TaxID=3395467 RepID=UPI0039BE1922
MTNIYEKLNDIQFDDVIEEETMSQLEQEKYFNQFKKKNIQKKPSNMKKRTLQIAAAVMLFAGGLPFLNHDIQANAVKMIENITYSFKDIITPQAEKYATHINETISLKKADVKLTDVFINDKYLTYNLLVDMDGEYKDVMADLQSVKINGKEMFEGLSGSGEYLKDKKIHSEIGIVDLRELTSKGDLDVEMTFSDVRYSKDIAKDDFKPMNNSFGFKFNVNTNKLDKSVKEKVINKPIAVGDNNIEVKKLSINPLSAQMNIDSKSEHNYDINLYDEKGKKYYFNIIQSERKEGITKSVLFFNQDVDSTGKIDDLYKAKSLDFEVIDTGKTHSGHQNIESKTDKKALHVEF